MLQENLLKDIQLLEVKLSVNKSLWLKIRVKIYNTVEVMVFFSVIFWSKDSFFIQFFKGSDFILIS